MKGGNVGQGPAGAVFQRRVFLCPASSAALVPRPSSNASIRHWTYGPWSLWLTWRCSEVSDADRAPPNLRSRGARERSRVRIGLADDDGAVHRCMGVLAAGAGTSTSTRRPRVFVVDRGKMNHNPFCRLNLVARFLSGCSCWNGTPPRTGRRPFSNPHRRFGVPTLPAP